MNKQPNWCQGLGTKEWERGPMVRELGALLGVLERLSLERGEVAVLEAVLSLVFRLNKPHNIEKRTSALNAEWSVTWQETLSFILRPESDRAEELLKRVRRIVEERRYEALKEKNEKRLQKALMMMKANLKEAMSHPITSQEFEGADQLIQRSTSSQKTWPPPGTRTRQGADTRTSSGSPWDEPQ